MKELNGEIVGNAAKVQTALRLSEEDQTTIVTLKKEVEKAWKLVDASHEKVSATLPACIVRPLHNCSGKGHLQGASNTGSCACVLYLYLKSAACSGKPQASMRFDTKPD